MSKKKATYSDVCYALQYAHERLFVTIRGGAHPIEYSLEPSRKLVEKREAEKFLTSGHAMVSDVGLIDGTPQSYSWKDS